MSSFNSNDKGTIERGYNVSSGSVYRGIKITGRDSCDVLDLMTVPETTTTAGTASNSSIRYGDYNSMVTDPVDGSFWFTAQYNSTGAWSTKVVHFTFSECPAPAPKTDEISALDNVTDGAIAGLTVIPNT